MPAEDELREFIKELQKAEVLANHGKAFEQAGLTIKVGGGAEFNWVEVYLETDIDEISFSSLDEAQEAAQQWLNSLVQGLLRYPED